jgi:hypothetical protein
MGVDHPQKLEDFRDFDTFVAKCIKIGSVIRLYPEVQISESALQSFYKQELFKLPPSTPSIQSRNAESLREKYALKYKESGKYFPESCQAFDYDEFLPREEREITVPNSSFRSGTSMSHTSIETNKCVQKQG